MKTTFQNDKLASALAALPDSPGVYLFKDSQGAIIYIGKALSLRSRVKSYFVDNSWRERPKLAVLMPKVCDLEVIVTNSEKEALILEANLVRKHMPRYNVHLKDDKRYPWLAITYDVAFPRLIMVRDPVRFRKENPRAKVFGPYVETGAMWDTVRVLRKVFPMRQRKTPLFKDRPCMNYHIGLCLGPCQKLVEEAYYNHMVEQVEMFLAGRQNEVMMQLRQEMEHLSENLQFEQAAKIRDRLRALETVVEKQQVMFKDQKVSQDIFAEAHTNKLMIVCLMRVREGKLISSETVPVPLVEKTTWDEAFQTFLDQYYTTLEDVAIPQEVLLEHEVEDARALTELLESRSAMAIRILVPQRGGKVNMVGMAKKNAQLALEKELQDESEADSRILRILSTLQAELETRNLPRRIECFDISNIQGTDNVASLVVFENSQPKKSDYRHFKVRSIEGSADDFASMREVVQRRYARIAQEGKPMPDLIIIDGGKGQLNAAMEALTELNVAEGQDIIGLAKKQEEVYRPGRSDPILLSRRSEALYLLQRVRNEAHRFAVTFHRKLRAKRSLLSGFDSLPGVGESRRKMLIQHFGTFDKLKQASLEELQAVPGLPKNVATAIYGALSAGKEGTKIPEEATDNQGNLRVAESELTDDDKVSEGE
ncbi:MAG TPA: excinuclease ABC subunit UvrC [Candidatus Obscuribacterales bacterium]